MWWCWHYVTNIACLGHIVNISSHLQLVACMSQCLMSHKIDCQGPPTTQLTLSHIFLYHILPILPVLGGAITFHGWWKLGIFRFTFEWILQLNLNKLIFLQLHWTVFAILIFEHTHYNICILTIKRNKQRCLISWDLWGIPSEFLVGQVCG